jgi:hypothetical protein
VQLNSMNTTANNARELTSNSHNTTNKRTDVTIIVLQTICDNSDMFRSVLIIFRELLNSSKTYIKIWMDY